MKRAVPLALLVAVTAAPVVLSAQQSPHDTVVGAVRAVDTRARTLEVTTGVGLALRVVRMRVPAETPITERGGALAFPALKPGDVVRVAFGARPEGFVAYTIERLGDMAHGRQGGAP